jgi:perosamine synthetase
MRSVMTKDMETRPAEMLSPAAAWGEEGSREPEASLPHDQGQLSASGIYTFWRGRVALYGILKSLGIGSGDSVLVPGFTCFAVPAAVLFTGARPLYVDIDQATFNISVESVQSAWDEHATARIKAVIIQHTFGLPANLSPILAWARKHTIAAIEDCAHAWGSRYQDEQGIWKQVGTAADAAFFSSQWTKPVSTGLGGWARINNPAFTEQNVWRPRAWKRQPWPSKGAFAG